MRPGENLSAFVYLCSYGQTAAADGLGLRGHCYADVFAILEQFVERMAAKHKKPTVVIAILLYTLRKGRATSSSWTATCSTRSSSQYYGELEARKTTIGHLIVKSVMAERCVRVM